MKPGNKQLFDHVKGDTFDGYQFTLRYKNKSPVILTDATIVCNFRKDKKTGELQLGLSVGSGLTITDGANGIMQIDNLGILDWPIGVYYWEIRIVFPTPDTKTYIGGTLEIIQNVP